MTTSQLDFLMRAAQAARDAGHIYPDYAACEAALESARGRSHLAVEPNNLFGQKQSHPPLHNTETLCLPTREFLHGAWIAVRASWVKFPDWAACFRERMALLHSLAVTWPNYRDALAAENGEAFINAVSRSWSTDPARANKVLALYDAHRGTLVEALEAQQRSREAAVPAAILRT